MDVDHTTGQRVFTGSLATFMATVEGLGDGELMERSRCRGWSRADVVVHVHLGLQDLLLGVHSPAPAGARLDTDAASYWDREVPTNDAGADDLDAVRFVQRVALAYRRPTGIVAHMRPTAVGVGQAVRSLRAGALSFQGHVMTTGNFLAMWAVELCVHHLDLAPDGDVLGPPTAESLALTRSVIEARVGVGLPSEWDDTRVALVGAGRMTIDPAERARLGGVPWAGELPVIR